ncbi:MAG: hypothetical protein M0Q43_03095 [Methanothrix sp.]|jgi:hypothetical protein|nr:hypothetical protein [Methanothrix sp.]
MLGFMKYEIKINNSINAMKLRYGYKIFQISISFDIRTFLEVLKSSDKTTEYASLYIRESMQLTSGLSIFPGFLFEEV